MPSVEFTLKDLNKLVGKKLSVNQVEDLAQYAKAEFDEYDKDTDTVYMSCADTAMPYLWSVEGIARIFKGALGIEKAIPKLTIKASKDEIIVDKSVQKIRPHIAMFSATGQKMSGDLLKQLIQLQEKLADTYGRRRRKVSIGIYSKKLITFPLTYKAVNPTEVKFTPLEFKKALNLAQILKQHPTGIKYKFTLEGFTKYPVLVDAKKKVLSFVPIINSNDLGRVQAGDTDILVEVTGDDEEAVDISCNILAYAFADRKFTISSVTVKSKETDKQTPFLMDETITISQEQVEATLGIKLKQNEIYTLLQKARYSVVKDIIHIPPYRSDILHQVDVIEDIAVMYGYDNFPTSALTSYTVGDVAPEIDMLSKVRNILVGFGMQEIMSPVLTNKELLYNKMECKDFGTIEIKEFMSSSYSSMRTWITPILLDVLSKNKHHVYPQLLFEQGPVTVRKGKEVTDYERVAAVVCGADQDYTVIRQMLDAILNALNVEYAVEETEHPSFIPGRVARIKVKGKGIAYIGEVHPKVLENFDIQLPTAAMELNLTDLYNLTK